MTSLRTTATAWLAAGRAAMAVEVVATRGSVPRGAGTRMLVTSDATAGTIGGGHLEWQAMAHARERLQSPDCRDTPPDELGFVLGASLGQCCGGAVTLRFTPLTVRSLAAWPADPPRWQLQLHGAGHVAQAVVHTLAGLDVALDWIDERESLVASFAFAAAPGAPRPRLADAAEAAVADAPPGAAVLVMTHRHDLDLRIVGAALRRADVGFVGLIGSATKRRRFVERLAEAGLSAEAMRRLTCPIGLAGIEGKEPAVIAVSVVAQLLQAEGPADQVTGSPPSIRSHPSPSSVVAAGMYSQPTCPA